MIYSKKFFKWRSVGALISLMYWAAILTLRLTVGAIIPWVIYYPIVGMAAAFLFFKFFAKLGQVTDYGLCVNITACLLNFLVLLSGSIPFLIISIAIALMGWMQNFVRSVSPMREYSKTTALFMYASMCAVVITASILYMVHGAILPSIIALYIVNLIAVCMYGVNHPTTYKHFEEMNPITVMMLDFYTASVFIHAQYIILSLLLPAMFPLSYSAALFYTFHGVILSVITPLMIDKAKQPKPPLGDELSDDASSPLKAEEINGDDRIQAHQIPSAPPWYDLVTNTILTGSKKNTSNADDDLPVAEPVSDFG